MSARKEVQTLIRRLQATLATNPAGSSHFFNPIKSTPFTAATWPQSLDLGINHTIKFSNSLYCTSNSRRWQHTTPSLNNVSENPATSAASENSGYSSTSSSADNLQQQVLTTALTLVQQLGWTRNALQTAATRLGLSPAIAGSFPRGAAHLVEAFNADCNDKLREILAERKEEIKELDEKDRLALGVKLRLEMIIKYLDTWPDALALQAQPLEVALSLSNYGTIADIIWRAAGDTSVDFSWYGKRAALSGIYVASELYVLTDKSENYRDTWQFLENRLQDMERMGGILEKKY